jgi:CelD/BcsL family acetyltransferase involved in cellulose biosynthesis
MQPQTKYRVVKHEDWQSVPAHWRQKDRAPTPFQTAAFLEAWYASLAATPGVEPVILEVMTEDLGRPVALFPLVARRAAGLREVSFADQELMDNGAPLLGPEFPFDQTSFAVLWRTVRAALPPADVLRLQKIPPVLAGRPNPMAALGGAYVSPLTQNLIHTPDDLEAYFARRTTKFNKEQRRVWRVFLRNDDAKFELVEDIGRALMLLEQLERLQSVRMRDLGLNYRLDEPDYQAFFRRLIRNGLKDGSVRFGTLTAGDQLVGGLLCLSNGASFAFTRICFAPGHWAPCSPGRLVLEQTIIALHIDGARSFDLSIGDFPYKADFGVQAEPLVDVVSALSWRGVARSSTVAVRQRLKKSPLAQSVYARLRKFPHCTASGPARPSVQTHSET